jgi:hypothetical protein
VPPPASQVVFEILLTDGGPAPSASDKHRSRR